MLKYERIFAGEGCKLICGVDEAGRGPLAGPVCAAAVVLPLGMAIDGVDDSKKLTSKKRELLFDVIISKSVDCAVAYAEVEEIDEFNILNATHVAMARAIKMLRCTPDVVMIDGNSIPKVDVRCKAIVGGDRLSLSIASASILAKVSRDRLMTKLAVKYPEYGFEKHKGYGTKVHMEALEKYGLCKIHRRTFTKKYMKVGDF
jgi:ribonuclease HII